MYYIINKVLFNPSNDLVEKQISCECLNMFIKKYEAVNFINQLKHISIFCEDIILSNPIKNEHVNNKDVDGYHIIYDDENTQKYNIYFKKSTLNKGYVYNTVDIDIKYIGFIEIISYKPNIKKIDICTPIYNKYNTGIKQDENIKNDIKEKYIDKISSSMIKSVLADNCVMPTIFEDKEINDEDITKKINIEKSDLTNINKKQKIENKPSISDKHLYVELNDQLIEELKKKLDRLALKKKL
jgi:hypothetical protein